MFRIAVDSIRLAPGQMALLGDVSGNGPGVSVLGCSQAPPPELAAGTRLGPDPETPWFRVLCRAWWPKADGTGTPVHWVESLGDLALSAGPVELSAWKTGFSLARITLSDKGYRGQRQDLAGPEIATLVCAALPVCLHQAFLLPDDPGPLKGLIADLALTQRFDLIITTGGTGLTPRDMAPEATLAVIEKRLPGVELAMVKAALTITPHGMLSRAVAGTLGGSLVINLPGSPKAVRENLAAVLPALGHAMKKLQGDPSDCACS